MRILVLFSIILVFLVPSNILAQTDDDWTEETSIGVSIIGEPVINLDSSNTLLRAYVDITNFNPSDGYYYLRLIQSATGTIISEENIIIREKSNGKAGADVAHLVTEDEINHTANMFGKYDIEVFTEFGTAVGNATFSIIKPSDSTYQTYVESLESDEESTELEESISQESAETEPELINTKKIPDWVKNIFVLYSYDEISENELLNALTFLIEQNIIEIS